MCTHRRHHTNESCTDPFNPPNLAPLDPEDLSAYSPISPTSPNASAPPCLGFLIADHMRFRTRYEATKDYAGPELVRTMIDRAYWNLLRKLAKKTLVPLDFTYEFWQTKIWAGNQGGLSGTAAATSIAISTVFQCNGHIVLWEPQIPKLIAKLSSVLHWWFCCTLHAKVDERPLLSSEPNTEEQLRNPEEKIEKAFNADRDIWCRSLILCVRLRLDCRSIQVTYHICGWLRKSLFNKLNLPLSLLLQPWVRTSPASFSCLFNPR